MKRIGGALLLLLGAIALRAQAADTVYYIHTDALGSPTVITDANRNVVERTQYAPYGQVLNRPEHDGPGYTGHEEDSQTGLTNMQARYDNKIVGRMISPDPMDLDPNTGANFNRYAYASNNPYKFTDPDGRQDCAEKNCKDTEKRDSPTTGCLTAGCSPSANTSVRIVDDSYRRGGTSTNTTPGPQTSQGTGSSGRDTTTYQHRYVVSNPICETMYPQCNADNAMGISNSTSAPSDKPIHEGVNMLSSIIPGHAPDNPINHFTDWANHTITNTTLPGHVFTGSVVTTFSSSGGYLFMTTVGTGSSSSWLNSRANEAIGITYFGYWQATTAIKINQQIIRAYQIP